MVLFTYIYHIEVKIKLILSLGSKEKITPADFKHGNGVRGFGYSFSNIGDGKKNNGKPYFAVGAVNINSKGTQKHADVLLFNSAPLDIQECEDKDCKTQAKITPNVLGKTDTGKIILILITENCVIKFSTQNL